MVSQPMTMGTLNAGVATSLLQMFWAAAKQHTAPAATYSLAALSAALALFLVYNVAAGGNPPRRSEADDNLSGSSSAT